MDTRERVQWMYLSRIQILRIKFFGFDILYQTIKWLSFKMRLNQYNNELE